MQKIPVLKYIYHHTSFLFLFSYLFDNQHPVNFEQSISESCEASADDRKFLFIQIFIVHLPVDRIKKKKSKLHSFTQQHVSTQRFQPLQLCQ